MVQTLLPNGQAKQSPLVLLLQVGICELPAGLAYFLEAAVFVF